MQGLNSIRWIDVSFLRYILGHNKHSFRSIDFLGGLLLLLIAPSKSDFRVRCFLRTTYHVVSRGRYNEHSIPYLMVQVHGA